MKLTRRDFLKGSVAAGAFMAFGGRGSLFMPSSANAFASSDPLQKWMEPMRNLDILAALRPPGLDNITTIPTLSFGADPFFGAGTSFGQVTIGEFTDQLHPQLPNPTTLWGYKDTTTGVTRHLAGLIVASRGTPVRLRFTNQLPADHIIPVDTSIPGANQSQNRAAVHLHGGFIPWISDGGPFDWWDPNGASGLSFQNGPGSVLDNITNPPTLISMPMVPGQADYYYPNAQSTRLMWYHDHAYGITRLNAYAGIATGYLLLDAINTAYTAAGKIPGLASTIPLVFQDKIFVSSTTASTDPTWYTKMPAKVQTNGSLWYAHNYEPDRWRQVKGGKYLAPPNPSVIAEFFGDTMLCNGTVSPFVQVEPKRYRFLVLNACNARFLNINLLQVTPGGEIATDPTSLLPTNSLGAGPPIIQIGNEAGFLVTETIHDNTKFIDTVNFKGNLFLAPAERADIIIDFTGKAVGSEFIMYSDAPGPFPGGDPRNDYFYGNLSTPQATPGSTPDTRNILKFKVVAGASDPQPAGFILDPTKLDPAPLTPITTPGPLAPPPGNPVIRDLTLNEDFDQYGRLRQLIGTTKPNLVTKGFGLEYLAPATEVMVKDAVEIWRVFNLTADTHPIHIHLVNAQIMSRQPFKMLYGKFTPTGAARGPEPEELGWKETIKMNPGEVTTLCMKFELPSTPFTVPSTQRAAAMGLPPGYKYYEYVYHCHILEHEEHDMMRPLIVRDNLPPT